MAKDNKRRFSQAPEETTQNKRNKVDHEATPAPAGPSHPATSPKRGKNSEVNQTVFWVRDPPTHLVAIKDIPWLKDNKVLDLFAEVKDDNDFFTAASIFWLYYFMYQRGEPLERRDQLLSVYVRPKLSGWEDAFSERWELLHNVYLAEWAQHIHLLMKRWIDSPAGSAFRTDLLKARNGGKAKPILTIEGIHQYISASDKKTYDGIEITLPEVIKLLWRFTHLADVVEVKGEGFERKAEEPIYWFQADMMALMAEKSARSAKVPSSGPKSWYSRISGVILTLVHQFILMNLGYQTRGGKVDSYDGSAEPPHYLESSALDHFDSTNVAKLLMRVPSEADVKDYDTPFEIYDYSLAEWKKHFEETGGLDSVTPKLNLSMIEEPHDKTLNREHSDICEGNVDGHITKEFLDEDVRVGHQARMEHDEHVQMMLDASCPKDTYFASDFQPAHLYPPAEVQNPQWTPWLAAMASTNVKGQLALMYRRVCALQSASLVLSLAYKQQADDLEADKKNLLVEAIKVRDVMAALKDTSYSISQVKQEIKSLNDEIAEGKKDPSILQYLKIQRNRPVRTSSPLTQLADSNQHVCSPSVSPKILAEPFERRGEPSADNHHSSEDPSGHTDTSIHGETVESIPLLANAMDDVLAERYHTPLTAAQYDDEDLYGEQLTNAEPL